MEGQQFLTTNTGYLLNLNYLYMETQNTAYIGLWLGPEKIFTQHGTLLNAGTLNLDFTALF
jgi:hypothetical protein